MANINSTVHYQQVLSMAIEDRSSGYQDLVSNNNALLAMMNQKGLWQEYSGPRIRQSLQITAQDAQWYSGYDTLDNPPIDLINDAYFIPKQVVVPVSLPMDEILNNSGENQVFDVLETYLDAAERALQDAMDTAIHSDGSANGGKQLTGLATAVPIVTNSGLYGGISRVDNAIWRTNTYDAHSMDTTIGTQVSSTTVRRFLNRIMTARSRGRRHADILLMSSQHYEAYDAATIAVQKIQKEGGLAKLGFSTLEYVGGGKRAEIVLDGGVGSNMPDNTTFGLESQTFRLRYHPDRNFDKLFDGDGMKPINQDAIAQFIGFMGELTMTNPLFNWRFYDSTPNS